MSPSGPPRAPTSAPLPTGPETRPFTVADPILPPTPSQPSTTTTTTSSSQSTSSTVPPDTKLSTTELSTTELSAPASLPLRPLFLSLLVACPLLAALPPRKMDLFTLMLGGAWALSAEEVVRGQRYGWRVAQAMKEREGAREQQASVGIGQMGEVGEGKGISDMMGEAVEDVFRESRLAEQARERGKRE